MSERLWIHVEVNKPKSTKTLRHITNVLDHLELELEDRGITSYYTMVDTYERSRFAEHFGFEFTGESVGDDWEIMVKEI